MHFLLFRIRTSDSKFVNEWPEWTGECFFTIKWLHNKAWNCLWFSLIHPYTLLILMQRIPALRNQKVMDEVDIYLHPWSIVRNETYKTIASEESNLFNPFDLAWFWFARFQFDSVLVSLSNYSGNIILVSSSVSFTWKKLGQLMLKQLLPFVHCCVKKCFNKS